MGTHIHLHVGVTLSLDSWYGRRLRRSLGGKPQIPTRTRHDLLLHRGNGRNRTRPRSESRPYQKKLLLSSLPRLGKNKLQWNESFAPQRILCCFGKKIWQTHRKCVSKHFHQEGRKCSHRHSCQLSFSPPCVEPIIPPLLNLSLSFSFIKLN